MDKDRIYDTERRPRHVIILHIVINMILIAVLALIVINIIGGKGIMNISDLFSGKRERTAGKDFPLEDITEFYYTVSTSTLKTVNTCFITRPVKAADGRRQKRTSLLPGQ